MPLKVVAERWRTGISELDPALFFWTDRLSDDNRWRQKMAYCLACRSRPARLRRPLKKDLNAYRSLIHCQPAERAQGGAMLALEKVLADLAQGRCTGTVDLRPKAQR